MKTTMFVPSLVVLFTCTLWCSSVSAQLYYKIVNVNSSKYLAVPNASRERGTQMIQWLNSNQPDINWEIQFVTNSTYKIRNRNSGLYLAVASADVNNGGKIIQWQDEGQRDILWEIIRVENSVYKIKNLNSNKFLAIAGGDTNNGGLVIQWDDHGQRDIKWTIQCYPSFRIKNRKSGKYLAILGASREENGQAVQWVNNGQRDISWSNHDYYDPLRTMNFVNCNSSFYLNPVPSNGTTPSNGTKIVQKCNVYSWRIIPLSNGYVKIQDTISGKYLAIEGGRTENGANVILWEDNGQLDIQWIFEPSSGDFCSDCTLK